MARKGDLDRHFRAKMKTYFKSVNAACAICGLLIDYDAQSTDPYSLNIDHIIPLAKGGATDLSNLQPTHRICNIRKHDNFWTERKDVQTFGYKNSRKW